MAGYVKVSINSPAQRQQWGDLLMSLAASAAKNIKQYMLTFIVDDMPRSDTSQLYEKPIGSGTLVEMDGIEGILTANHVAEDILTFSSFALCIGEFKHRLDIFDKTIIQHIVVGKPPNNTPPQIGPDMSFLRIRDESLLQKLRDQKAFYPLRLPNNFLLHPIFKYWIWVSVAPTEFHVRMTQVETDPTNC
jgi:hypothetical protein